MKNKGKKKHLPLKLLVTALAAAFICFAVYQFCNQRAILANQQERMEQLQQQQQRIHHLASTQHGHRRHAQLLRRVGSTPHGTE